MDRTIWLKEIDETAESWIATNLNQYGFQVNPNDSPAECSRAVLVCKSEDRELLSEQVHEILRQLREDQSLWVITTGILDRKSITKDKRVSILSPTGMSVQHIEDRLVAELALDLPSNEVFFGNLLRFSKPMRDLCNRIKKVAKLKDPVLILGETGSGKGVVAEELHRLSVREGELLKVNSAEFNDNALESELFGHKKGAFTGADSNRVGLIQAAGGSSFFLDEIGEMKMLLQARILSVIEDLRVRKVGDNNYEKISARFIFATSKDLKKEVQDGAFRKDLYQRLRVYTLRIPPLRERRSEILLLANHFLEAFNRAYKRSLSFTDRAHDALFAHPWYGNVRELRSVVYQAAGLSDEKGLVSDSVLLEALDESIDDNPQGQSFQFSATEEPWDTVQERLQKAYFHKLIAGTKSMKEAMEISGFSKARFYELKKKLGL
ncbi:MAG: sigma 54-interacting transcriptional regulator [Acidobacteriota bacterium]|nr:sigma 54-interacting transcriptional regulator [Acidobacteriota bacterium]